MSKYIQSQAEATEDDESEEISTEEWNAAFEQAEREMEQRRNVALPAAPQAAAAAAPEAVDRMDVEPASSEEAALEEAIAVLRGPRAQVEDAAAAPAPAEKPYNKSFRRVLFTLNNPGDFRPSFNEEKMAYMVWQVEKGKQGTEHIQGYIRFKKMQRAKAVDTMLGSKHPHLEECRGNEQQCKDYCTKEDTRVSVGEEHGTFNPDAGKQGHRSDWDAIATACKAGKPLKEIAETNIADWIRYHQGITSLHDLLAPPPPAQRPVEVMVLWGPTGVGKTHRVLSNPDLARDGGIYKVKPGRDPWGSYKGEKTIFFDEFDWEKWSVFDMNEYLDKWTTPLDCRYRNKFAEWTRVIICSNSSPMTWWPNASQPVIDAFRRRLGGGCRYVTHKEQDITESRPEPDFSPADGRLDPTQPQSPAADPNPAPQQ